MQSFWNSIVVGYISLGLWVLGRNNTKLRARAQSWAVGRKWYAIRVRVRVAMHFYKRYIPRPPQRAPGLRGGARVGLSSACSLPRGLSVANGA